MDKKLFRSILLLITYTVLLIMALVRLEALGGGGNAAAAGAQIPDRTVEEVRRELTAVLDSYFDSGKEAPKEP